MLCVSIGIMKELRIILRDLREDRDIRQETIADYLGVTQQAYSNYENGRREIPISMVKMLADFYHVSTDYLLGSNISYRGNVNMNATYIDDITLHDLLYDIQGLDATGRKDLIKYIKFLHHDSDNAKRKL